MSFGEESTRTDQPNFPPHRFLTKAIIQTAINKMMGWIENGPDFSSVNTFPPKSQCDVLDLSVLSD
jgi:hypothetical protein